MKISNRFMRMFRHQEHTEDVVDMSFGPYSKLLSDIQKYIPSLNNGESTITDLGCGGATLLKFLNHSNINFNSYKGIDLHIGQMELNLSDKNITFEENDLQAIIPESDCNLIFACNSFVYCKNIKAVTENISERQNHNKYLVIIEPIKSLFWETYFDGIKLNYRSDKTMSQLLIKNGWELLSFKKMYLRKILGNWFWPISYTQVYCITNDKQ